MSPVRLLRTAAAVGCGLGLAAGAMGQTSVTVDCAGASIPSSGTSAPNVVRTSTGTINAASGYQFGFNPIVQPTGFLGVIAFGSSQRPLSELLNSLFIGGQRVLFGAMRNPTNALPTLLDTEPVGGTFSGLTLSLTFRQELLADGRGRASITDIVKPSFVGIDVISGGATYTVWTPPAPVVSEWHLLGNLQSVRETGLAPTSGPAKIRYLDDASFGPILGGVGAESEYPSPPTPQNVTAAQSAFGTTASFGLPGVGGVDRTVYRTSPPRNAGMPTDSAKSRGIGLTLWPNTRDFWPDDRNGQWTMVWDLLIPEASWNAGLAAGGQVVPLVEDSSNNNSIADAFVAVTGSGAGTPRVGHSVAIGSATPAPAIQPGQWFRLALVVDHYGKREARVFVNGVFAGTTGSDWVYNACKSTDPRWGDPSMANPAGTPIPPATWAGWGQFPSPWATSSTGATTASTLSLFADITGKGESVYVANMLFTDEAMTDAQVGALGGPNARGIVWLEPAPCAADFNQSGAVTVQDIFDFLAAYFAGCP